MADVSGPGREGLVMRFLYFLLLTAGLAAATEELPGELEHLATVQEEAPLVEAIRDFDQAQIALAVTDRGEADTLAKSGGKEQAQAKLDAARKRVELVRKAYEWGLTRYPKNARLHNYYGELLYDEYKDFAAALRQWYLALQEDPKLANAHNNLGIHLFHSGDYRMGLERLDEALRLDPNHPDFLFNMAQMYLVYSPQIQELRGWKKEKVYREAMKLSKKAAAVSPEDFALLQDYAVNFYAGENFDADVKWKDAASAWRSARAKAGKPDQVFYTWLNEARVWLKEGDAQQAKTCLEEALKVYPQSEVARDLLNSMESGGVEDLSDKKKSPKNLSGRQRSGGRE